MEGSLELDEMTVDALVDFVHDPVARRSAIRALIAHGYGPTTLVDALLALRTDPDDVERRFATESLARLVGGRAGPGAEGLGDTAARRELIQAALRASLEDPAPEVRVVAARSVARSDDRTGQTGIVENVLTSLAGAAPAAVQLEAAECLYDLGARVDVVEAVATRLLVSSNPTLRSGAARLLGHVEATAPAARDLEGLLLDPHPIVRAAAVSTMLSLAQTSPSWRQRTETALLRLLGRSEDHPTSPPLPTEIVDDAWDALSALVSALPTGAQDNKHDARDS
jgi:HEAT repeat protein